MSKYFINVQSDFYRYMINYGSLAPKTARDYISRLKFLAISHKLDMSITAEKIEDIMSQENKIHMQRGKYNTKHAMGDFRSGLNKFLSFVNFDYEKQYEKDIQKEIEIVNTSINLRETEKATIIQSRIGQGMFRKKLINYWKGCSFSGCDINDILIASHIKPWRLSDNYERLDSFNGLLLLPNYDKLFDKGYLTISITGKVIYSKFFSHDYTSILGLSRLTDISIDERHKPYLEYHSENCFMG